MTKHKLPPEERRSQRISVFLTPSEEAEIRELAEPRFVSEFVRKAIRQHCAHVREQRRPPA